MHAQATPAHTLLSCAALVLVLGVAACATETAPAAGANPPAATASGPSARLLLRGAVPGDDRYAVFELADSLQCKGPRLLAGGNAKKGPDPATLAAGALTTLDFVVLRAGQTSCVVRWSFTPEAGKTYLVTGIVVGNGCTARLLDASQPDRPQTPAGTLMRSAPGQPCVPLDKARAAAESGSLIQGGQHNGEAVLYPMATAADLQGLIKP